MKPMICIGSDYDDFFRGLVEEWVAEKTTPFKSKRVVVNAGPYRMEAVTAYYSSQGTLHLDFYSPLRNGFGRLSEQDVEEIKEHYL